MTTAQIIICVSIFVYLAAVLTIGAYFTKKNKSVDDFYLGGRKLGPLVTAMSAEASDMSSWLLMGLPGVALLTGSAEAVWTAAGLAVGTYINWLVVAKRIRVYTSKINAITIPDFFTKRFHDRNNLLTLVAAVIIIIFFVPYTASGFKACGTLFSSLFGVSYLPAMIICAAVIVAYTTLGGFLAASTTDFIQSIVMTAALAIVLIFGFSNAGGVNAVLDNAKQIDGYLSLTETHNVVTGAVGKYGFITIVSTLAWGLGYFGMPHVLLRFMAIKDKKQLKLSRRIASVWVVISMGIAVVIGFIGYKLMDLGLIFKDGITAGSSKEETVLIEIAKFMSNLYSSGLIFVILAVLAGVILAGILASTMSTADSQLLAAASGVSQNILHDTFGLNLSNRASMLIARGSVLLISVVAVFIARDENSSVFRIVSFAWAGFGATFGPVVLSALFWKRANKWGALSGMLIGGITVFVWKYLIRPLGGAWDIYELLPAFILALAAIVIVSLLTSAPEQEIIDEFEAVNAEVKEK